MRKLFAVVLLSILALGTSSCTEAQWRQFQEINTKVANYVNDAMLAISLISGFVESAVPAADRNTVSDVYDAIQACNSALQTEAGVVQDSNTPLDTPAHISAAFPQFISSWDALMTSLHNHNLQLPSSAAPTHRAGFRSPRIVRDARPTP